jgi:hypothetical protein
MTGFQSPQLLTDLYRDLRDRRLLPLVVVLLVGMAVVPIALSSKASTPAVAPPPAAVAKKTDAPATEVVVSDPGVRDYRKRLSGDTPKDPFVQLFTTPVGGGSADEAASGAGSGAGGGAATGTGTGTTDTTGSDTTSGGSTPVPQTESKYYFYRVKVRSGQVGKQLKVRESVGSLTPLPSKAVPAVTFLGVTTNRDFTAETAVFLVSSFVSSVDGEGSCTFAGTQCQLLSLKPGQHQDLVWTDGLVYRLQLVKFDLISRSGTPSSNDGDSGSGGDDSSSDGGVGRYFSF